MKTTGFITRNWFLHLSLVPPVTDAVMLGGVGLACASTSGDTHDTETPSYRSSINTTATEDSRIEAAADHVRTKAAKIDLTQAVRAGAGAVPSGAPTSIELTNGNGTIVYLVTVATSNKEPDVIVDAGNSKGLATQVNQRKRGQSAPVVSGNTRP